MKKSIILFVLLSIYTFSSPRITIINHENLDPYYNLTGYFNINDCIITPTVDLYLELWVMCPLCGCPLEFPQNIQVQVFNPNNEVISTSVFEFTNCYTKLTPTIGLELNTNGQYRVELQILNPPEPCGVCDVWYDVLAVCEF